MANMIPISTVTVGSGGASAIEFTNIPQNYTDLCLVVSLRSNRSAQDDNPVLKLNASSSSYTERRLVGDGTTPASYNSTTIYLGVCPGNSSTANTFGNIQVYFPNYASSNYKSISIDCVTENNQTQAYTDLGAGLWSNTANINQITITPFTGTLWLQYSSATLYGIRKY